MDKLLRGPALTQAIQERIKRYITENRLSPGASLPPQAQLAQDLGVSLGSLREAVKGLESLGILDVRHGNGIFVREFNFDSVLDLLSYGFVFSPGTISEILQIRKWLEVAAVDEIIHNITEHEIGQMEDILARWEKKAGAGEPVIDEDRAFHRTLNGATGNRSLKALQDIFWVVYHTVHARFVGRPVHAPPPLAVVQRHRAILAAVRCGDAAQARQIIEEDLRGAEDWATRVASLDASDLA